MSELTDALREFFRADLADNLHTALPGRIESYDKDEVRAEVTPMVGKNYVVDGPTNYKSIVSVPVLFPRSADAHITFPLKQGDGVLLIFSERSIEEWLNSSVKLEDSGPEQKVPSNARKFSLTDAIAIPGLFSFNGKGSKIDSGDELEIRYKNIKISSDGDKVNIATSSTPLIALDGCVTKKSICAFTGAPHPDASATVRASS